MDTPIRYYPGECDHLSFASSYSEPSNQDGLEHQNIKVPYNPNRPDLLRLRELAGRPILSFPVDVPAYDPRGIASAATFESWKKATDSKMGIAGNYFSFKAGRYLACHSYLEAKLARYFELCPFVVEIRTQYPSWERERYLELARNHERMRKTEILTIDLMLTLKIPGYSGVIYHAVSGKPAKEIENPKVMKRHAREKLRIQSWGCSHEIMTELTVSNLEHNNNQRLFSYMRKTENIAEHQLQAEEFAFALVKSTARGTLDRVIQMVSKRLGHSTHMGYRLFAIANYLGYLQWDHRFSLNIHSPIKLRQE